MLLGDNNFKNKHYKYLKSVKSSKVSSACYDWLEMFAESILLVVTLLIFVFRVVSVSGSSMMNTLFHADRLVIKKWYYEPQDGDIVVIRKGQNLDKPIIKRVIATEGQTLKIDYESGEIIVNGKTLSEPYIKEPMITKGDIEVPVIIPKGYCYVMGDNRNDSWDSRFAVVGLIRNEDVIGKAVFRIYPLDRIGNIS